MKKTLSLSLAALFFAHSLAVAAPSFEKNYNSGRVQTVEYSDNLVLKVVGYPNNATVIEFTKGEEIETVYGAALLNWLGAAVEDRVFIAPETGAKAGTVIITTNKRSYILDVVPAHGKYKSADRVSKIIFTNPSSNSRKTKYVFDDEPKVKRGYQPKDININYTMEVVNKETDIRPLEVYDDGTFTYFKFPFHTEIPAIYKSSLGSEAETTINTHNKDDYVVVQGISEQWNLRLGDALIGVFNETFTSEANNVKK